MSNTAIRELRTFWATRADLRVAYRMEQPAGRFGEWAFLCHLLYHIDMGMFRIVSVSERVAAVSR